MSFDIKSLSIVKAFGYSMFPLLLDGDIVYLKKVKFHKINVNDIICVKKKGSIFTHRVVYISAEHLITKGDTNLISDGKIYPKNIIGLVYKIKRGRQILGIDDLYLIQSTIYFKEIVRVKRALEKQNLEFVFLKGLPLHLYYEGLHPRRIYADCDILIKRDAVFKAKTVLRHLGYSKIKSDLSTLQAKIKKQDSEVSFVKINNGTPIVIDLHFEVVFMMTQLGKLDALYPQETIDKLTSDFIRDKRMVKFETERFPILSHTNLIIYLALHLYHHNFSGAHRFDFLKKVLASKKPDYDHIQTSIGKYKLNNFVYPCFLLLEKYYKVRFDTRFMSSIKPKKVAPYIIEYINKLNIFDEEARIRSGIKRFRNLYELSPNNTAKKLTVLFDRQVIYAIFWVFTQRLKSIKW